MAGNRLNIHTQKMGGCPESITPSDRGGVAANPPLSFTLLCTSHLPSRQPGNYYPGTESGGAPSPAGSVELRRLGPFSRAVTPGTGREELTHHCGRRGSREHSPHTLTGCQSPRQRGCGTPPPSPHRGTRAARLRPLLPKHRPRPEGGQAPRGAAEAAGRVEHQAEEQGTRIPSAPEPEPPHLPNACSCSGGSAGRRRY